MKQIFLICLALLLLPAACLAQVTNPYHFKREFVPVAYTNTGTPTAYKVIMGARALTGIVGPTNVIVVSNETHATEYEGFAWGYESPVAAWTSAFSVYQQYYQIHSNVFYDNAGYVKGTHQAYGDWGAFVWYLQNTITFTSSVSTKYVSPYGVTSEIASVLVGTLGDYCPQTKITDVGPNLDTNYLGAGSSTDYVARADITAYYKLVLSYCLRANNDDSDGDGIPDFADGFDLSSSTSGDDLSPKDYFMSWQAQLSGYADPTQALLRFTYNASDPASVSLTATGYVAASGNYRLWLKQALKARNKAVLTSGGDYIPPGIYAATSLGYSASNRIVDLFIEAVQPGTNRQLVIEVDPDGSGPKNFVCTDKINMSVLGISLEPVTIRPSSGSTFPLYNPCSIVLGSNALFEVNVLPTNILDASISWRVATGDVSFVNGNTGRLVTVNGVGLGPAKLAVAIQGYADYAPTIALAVTNSRIVNASVYIVCDTAGSMTSMSPTAVSALISGVNDIYRQAGIVVSQQGPVHYIYNTAWLDADSSERSLIRSTTNGTGGIEIYCTQLLDSGGFTGANVGPGNGAVDGLVVGTNCNFRTLAHEIGHAGLLQDIYFSSTGATISASELVRESWSPLDWNGGISPQYYDPYLTQRDLIKRLLMYGTLSDQKADIPNGKVHGIDRAGAAGLLDVGYNVLVVPHHD